MITVTFQASNQCQITDLVNGQTSPVGSQFATDKGVPLYVWCTGGRPCSGWSQYHTSANPDIQTTTSKQNVFLGVNRFPSNSETVVATVTYNGRSWSHTPTIAGRLCLYGFYLADVLKVLGGNPNGSPTYLEELHKLDNYTKAQYIPSNVYNVPL